MGSIPHTVAWGTNVVMTTWSVGHPIASTVFLVVSSLLVFAFLYATLSRKRKIPEDFKLK